jgi:hypothetical protein
MSWKTAAAAAFLTLVTSPAWAGWFQITPKPTPVPEFDASSGVAAIALLATVAAVMVTRGRGRNH